MGEKVLAGQSPPLAGQAAIVTGAASGIGRAVAQALGAAGATVGINYRSKADAAEALAEEIKQAGGRARAFQTDVSQEEQVQRMFRAIQEEFGRLDILVNNAGIQQDAPFLEMTREQWEKVISVNLTGYFLCAREAARAFARRGVDERVSKAAGKIIFISSVHELIPWAGHANYAASKGGVEMLMKTLAQELAPKKIRVNSIAPGAIKTAINRPMRENPETRAKTIRLIPYGRLGEPEDIGRAAVWLASDESDYVHGVSLFVDGGMALYPEFARGG